MSPKQEEKLDGICKQVSEMHTTMFGAHGQGGFVREFKEHTVQDQKNFDDLKQMKWKVIGGASVMVFIIGVLIKIIH